MHRAGTQSLGWAPWPPSTCLCCNALWRAQQPRGCRCRPGAGTLNTSRLTLSREGGRERPATSGAVRCPSALWARAGQRPNRPRVSRKAPVEHRALEAETGGCPRGWGGSPPGWGGRGSRAGLPRPGGDACSRPSVGTRGFSAAAAQRGKLRFPSGGSAGGSPSPAEDAGSVTAGRS